MSADRDIPSKKVITSAKMFGMLVRSRLLSVITLKRKIIRFKLCENAKLFL